MLGGVESGDTVEVESLDERGRSKERPDKLRVELAMEETGVPTASVDCYRDSPEPPWNPAMPIHYTRGSHNFTTRMPLWERNST